MQHPVQTPPALLIPRASVDEPPCTNWPDCYLKQPDTITVKAVAVARSNVTLWVSLSVKGPWAASATNPATFKTQDGVKARFFRASASSNLASSICSVVLMWNPSADTNVTGYFVYRGAASQNYTNKIDAGNVTTLIVLGIPTNITNYFVVTAYNVLGLESVPSNEANYAAKVERPEVLMAMP